MIILWFLWKSTIVTVAGERGRGEGRGGRGRGAGRGRGGGRAGRAGRGSCYPEGLAVFFFAAAAEEEKMLETAEHSQKYMAVDPISIPL